MHSRVTIRQVAAQAGVHFTTAALALKESRRVHPDTRKKVRATADALGYMPDPMLSSLCAYRQARRSSAYHGTLAWITNESTRDGWRYAYRELYLKGARERALLHGYQVEEFWLRKPGLTSQRASQILHDRGIQGVLIAPLPANQGHLHLDWDKFSPVTFGHTVARPVMPSVSIDRFTGIVRCMRRLRAMGYRRIGCVSFFSSRLENHTLGAFHVEREHLPESHSIPICKMVRPDRKSFLGWFKDYRPEALVSTEMYALHWLHEAGYRMPSDIQVLISCLQDARHDDFFADASGVMEDSVRMGHIAVDLLAGMLQRGELGIPENAQRIQLPGLWVEGLTAIPKRALKGKFSVWKPKPSRDEKRLRPDSS